MRNVPQSEYTEDYFEHCCEGFTPDGTPGRRIMTLLSHANILKHSKVLDIACGRGEVAHHLGSKGIQVVSVDYSLAAMKRFHEVNADREIFIRQDISKGMPWLSAKYFDLVVMADIVEHVYPEQLQVIGLDAVRVCLPGGTILIDTPIMKGGESKLHVDIKESAQEVHAYFPGTELVNTHWHKKPEHCNIILRKL
jgi:2-polyprenyl-3-methyl-5-hydroxy-6-metoxy-1,4-benzoquinol methylase